MPIFDRKSSLESPCFWSSELVRCSLAWRFPHPKPCWPQVPPPRSQETHMGPIPTSTAPTSTQRLAQKEPSRKPRVGPNMPEDLTRPAREGRWGKTLRGQRQAFLSEGKETKEEGAGRRGAQAIVERPEQQEQAALTIAGVSIRRWDGPRSKWISCEG